MSAGARHLALAGDFATVYPAMTPEAKRLAAAIRVAGVHIGDTSLQCVTSVQLARARESAAKLPALVEAYLAATDPNRDHPPAD